jgi:hypothetical protein
VPRTLIRSLRQFVDAVAKIRDEWNTEALAEPWFRGHADAAWSLKPGLYRTDDPDENQIRGEFQRRGLQFVGSREPRDEWEWYFLMQHFGAPTRLLDWTDGALLGLYFAIRQPHEDTNAAVWLLDPRWLNNKSIEIGSIVDWNWDQTKPYLPTAFSFARIKPTLPLALDPPHISPRVVAQRSRFTIHGRKPDALDELAQEPSARLIRLDIAKGSVEQLKLDLALCGIDETTIFPDLEGLARQLSWDYGGTAR